MDFIYLFIFHLVIIHHFLVLNEKIVVDEYLYLFSTKIHIIKVKFIAFNIMEFTWEPLGPRMTAGSKQEGRPKLRKRASIFLNLDSRHARLNSHYKAWSYKKKKNKKICLKRTYR